MKFRHKVMRYSSESKRSTQQGTRSVISLQPQIMRWSWLSWHSPDELELDHPPREKEGKYSVGGNLSEGGPVWGKLAYQHSAIRVGEADALAHSTCSAGLESNGSSRNPCLRSSSHPARDREGKSEWLERKVTCREGKAAPNYQRTQASSVSHWIPSLQRDRSRGPWAQGGFTPQPNPQVEPGSKPQLDYLHQETSPQWHQPTQGSPVHCSGPPDLSGKMLGGCCKHCSALVEIKTLQHTAWSRRCLHMELLKSWLKISFSHVIFLVQSKFFTCLAALWGDEHYNDGTWNLQEG